MNRDSDEHHREPVDPVRIRPDYAEVWNNLGIALGNLGRQTDALARLKRHGRSGRSMLMHKKTARSRSG